MDYKKSKAPVNTVTRNIMDLCEDTGNIYESVAIIGKRANQISLQIKDDLSKKLAEFASATIDVDVEVTELMGSETYLYLSTTGKEGNIIARVDPRTSSKAGQKIKIALDTNHLHFFDKETEITTLIKV